MTKLPRIYRTEKVIEKGLIYIRFTCGCVFLDKEDRKRKKRSIFEVRNGKRSNRIFCPNHKNNSFIKNRFKICPTCESTITVANNTVEGICSKCSYIEKQEEYKKKKEPKKRDCQQYGKEYTLKPKEKIISEPMCKNRAYCLSFIKQAITLLQCANCLNLDNDIFGD